MKKLMTMTVMLLLTMTAMAQDKTAKQFSMPPRKAKTAVKKAQTDFPIIQEQPAGNLKQYTRLGGGNNPDGYLAQSGYAYIVFATDGSNDVWLKDPVCWFNTGAWVKGKLSSDKKTITVAMGQNLSYSSTYDAALQLGAGKVTGSSISRDKTITEATYTIDDNVIHLQNMDGESYVLGVFWSDDGAWQGYCDWSTAYIDEDYNPENPVDPTQPVTEIPEDLETATYAMMLFDLSFGSDGKESGRELIQTDAIVGFKDGKVYIQGLSGHARDGWVVGTVEGNTITIPAGQYQGTYTYNGKDYPIYLLGCDEETEEVKDIVFNYDPENGTLELADGLWLVDNSDPQVITTAFGVYDNVMLLSDGGSAPLIPADLETSDYLLMLFDLSFGTDGKESGRELIQTSAKVGFMDGKVYIQGLSGVASEGWVIGSVEGNTITIPSGQYQGTYTYGGTDYDIFLLGCDKETEEIKDIVFTYDPETGTLELREDLWIVDSSSATAIDAAGVYDSVILLKGEEEGPATAITRPQVTTEGSCYNLQGMRISKPQKGIYIQNGKKFIVK